MAWIHPTSGMAYCYYAGSPHSVQSIYYDFKEHNLLAQNGGILVTLEEKDLFPGLLDLNRLLPMEQTLNLALR
jgi:hypothetical protein